MQVTIQSIPASLQEFETLAASGRQPERICALFLCALALFDKDRDAGTAAMNLLRGPRPMTPYDAQFLRDRLRGKAYLPLAYFDSNTFGDVLSRVTNDVDTIDTSLQQSISQVITAVCTMVFIFVMMLVVSPVLTLIGICVIPICGLVSMKVVKHSQRYFQGQQSALGELTGYVEEMYNGQNVIAAFGKEEDVIGNFEDINNRLYNNGWRAQFSSSIIMPLTQALTNIGYVGVAVVSGWLCINGRLSIGMIQSFIQYLRQFSQPINQVSNIANIMQATMAAAQRVFEFLDAEEEVPEAEKPQFPEIREGNVDFSHVRFGYTEDRTLIHDLDLHVHAGDKIAIVGPTGAGKTTLVNLILRFYDVNGGSITIDGVDVRDMKREALRSMIGMVLQDTWLFAGTIKENIRYGRLDATDQEVTDAARAAHANGLNQWMTRTPKTNTFVTWSYRSLWACSWARISSLSSFRPSPEQADGRRILGFQIPSTMGIWIRSVIYTRSSRFPLTVHWVSSAGTASEIRRFSSPYRKSPVRRRTAIPPSHSHWNAKA